MPVIGYARVSTTDQNLELQENALRGLRDHQIGETQWHQDGGWAMRRVMDRRVLAEFA
jgi:DNA invertase Pin-like site-specific DNA recombinase